MSTKNCFTTADYLEWDTMLTLIRRLYNDGDYRFGLLIGGGSFFGLRVSDLRTITWEMLLEGESFSLSEKKTGKRRVIKINVGFRRYIQDCYTALKISDKRQKCFITKQGTVYSTQYINRHFKDIKHKYGLKIKNFSTHTMRKTFGRKVVDSAGSNSEMALIRLSDIFNHSSSQITRRYLGLRQQELLEVYDALDY